MTDEVALRPAGPGDEPFLIALYADGHPEFQALGLPEPALAQLVGLQRRAQLQQYRASYPTAVDQLIAIAGQPVGRCWVWVGSQEHRLLDLAVHSRYRRRGIGRAVVSRLCRQADAAGLPLRLSVWQDNPAAQQLYLGLGFVPEPDGSEPAGYQGLCWTAGAVSAASSPTGCV